MSPKSLRLIFVRHPETEWEDVKDPESNKAGQRLLGSTDVSLSAKGRMHAEHLSQLLQGEGISYIESSPLERARVTAQAISSKINILPVFREELREINFGDCEGLTFEEVRVKFPNVHRDYLMQGSEVSFPGGESFSGFRTRVHAWLGKLCTSHDDQTVLVVTHGGVIRVALCALLGWPPETFWNLRQDYGSINVIGLYGDRRVIERINSRTDM